MGDYFLVTVDSDGEVRVYQGDERRILNHLDKDEDTEELLCEPFGEHEGFQPDPQYWGENRVLIIKGEIVTPKPVSVSYELS